MTTPAAVLLAQAREGVATDAGSPSSDGLAPPAPADGEAAPVQIAAVSDLGPAADASAALAPDPSPPASNGASSTAAAVHVTAVDLLGLPPAPAILGALTAPVFDLTLGSSLTTAGATGFYAYHAPIVTPLPHAIADVPSSSPAPAMPTDAPPTDTPPAAGPADGGDVPPAVLHGPIVVLGPGSEAALVEDAEVIIGLPAASPWTHYEVTVTGAQSGPLDVTLAGYEDTLTLATTTGVVATIAGAEHVVGSDHGDVLTISGPGGDIHVQGGAGNDRITVATPAVAVIEGGAGNNTLIGSSHTADTLSYEHATSGVVLDLRGHVASDNGFGGTDSVSGFEDVVGSAHDDVITLGDTVGFWASVAGGAGNDTVHLGSDASILVRLSGVEAVDVVGGNPLQTQVYVTDPTSGARFDLTGGADPQWHGTTHLDLYFSDPTAVTIGGGSGDIHLRGVDQLHIGGTTSVTFDGSVLNGDGMLLSAANSRPEDGVLFDVSLETGAVTMAGGMGADTFIGTADDALWLMPGETATLTELSGSALSGTARASYDHATEDRFSHIGSLAQTMYPGYLRIDATAIGIASVDLQAGTISGAGGSASIGSFTAVTNLSSVGLDIRGDDAVHSTPNALTAGSGGDTLTGGRGGDTLTGGAANDRFVYRAASDSTFPPGTGGYYTDLVRNFQDAADVFDVAAVSSVTQHFAGDKSSQGTDFATAFAGAAAGDVSYLVLTGYGANNSTTFVHVAGGAGYSASDLIVRLEGAHTLTAANFNLHG